MIQQVALLMEADSASCIANPCSAPSAALWLWVDRETPLKSFAMANIRRYQFFQPKTVSTELCIAMFSL